MFEAGLFTVKSPNRRTRATSSGAGEPRVPPRFGLLELPWAARSFYSEGAQGLFRTALRRHGDVVGMKLGPFDIVVISRPEHIRQVLVTNIDGYTKDDPILARLRPLAGNGIFMSEGALWRAQRRLVQPEFTRKSVAAMVDAMSEVAESIAADWALAEASSQKVNVTRSMREAAMRIICCTVMNADLGSDAERLGRAIERSLATVGVELMLPSLLAKLGRPALDAFMAHQVAELDAFIERVIEERADAPEADIVGRLRRATHPETGHSMSLKQLRDELMTLFIAGHETTATTLAWTWAVLAERPELQRRLHEEALAVLGERSVTAADLPKLTLTRAVIEEALRMHPPAAFVPRTARRDDELSGYRIKAGTIVVCAIYMAHHREDVFSDPESFRPERFLSEASEPIRQGHDYFPFGAGPRLCMGNHFAMAEAQVILATLARRFEAKPPARRVRPTRLLGIWRPARPVRLTVRNARR